MPKTKLKIYIRNVPTNLIGKDVMNPIAVITGAGSGIGQALAWQLALEHHITVLAIGRRKTSLKETAQKVPQYIQFITADVSNPQDRIKILNRLSEQGHTVRFLVHNAAVLEPVKPLLQLSLNEWRTHQAINVEAPLFLTQTLLSKMQNTRILHISSGAAHSAYVGWGAYCTSKAALYMIYRILRQELAEKDILIGSARPGVVDTPMQNRVRRANKIVFPALEKFKSLKEEDKLYQPQQVARFLAHLLLETEDSEFSAKEWDIRETNF